MEQSLFLKHQKNINKNKEERGKILLLIREKTGVVVEEEELVVSKRGVLLNISSSKKQKLFQKNIQRILKEGGFNFFS